MDTARRVLGILLIVPLPPALLYWLLIHPFVRFWRKLGPWFTYVPVVTACVALGVILYRARDRVLGTDLGTNWALLAVGVVLYLSSAWLTVLTRRQLKTKILVGFPEVSGGDDPGKLLQEGVYAHVRHPRYLSVVIGVLGWSLVVNFLGVYLTVLASVAALYVLTLLEERELVERFGDRYESYRSRVPALIPRLRRKTGEA